MTLSGVVRRAVGRVSPSVRTSRRVQVTGQPTMSQGVAICPSDPTQEPDPGSRVPEAHLTKTVGSQERTWPSPNRGPTFPESCQKHKGGQQYLLFSITTSRLPSPTSRMSTTKESRRQRNNPIIPTAIVKTGTDLPYITLSGRSKPPSVNIANPAVSLPHATISKALRKRQFGRAGSKADTSIRLISGTSRPRQVDFAPKPPSPKCPTSRPHTSSPYSSPSFTSASAYTLGSPTRKTLRRRETSSSARWARTRGTGSPGSRPWPSPKGWRPLWPATSTVPRPGLPRHRRRASRGPAEGRSESEHVGFRPQHFGAGRRRLPAGRSGSRAAHDGNAAMTTTITTTLPYPRLPSTTHRARSTRGEGQGR